MVAPAQPQLSAPKAIANAATARDDSKHWSARRRLFLIYFVVVCVSEPWDRKAVRECFNWWKFGAWWSGHLRWIVNIDALHAWIYTAHNNAYHGEYAL